MSPRSPTVFYHGEWGSVGEGGSPIGYWGNSLYPTIKAPCRTCSSASSRGSSAGSKKPTTRTPTPTPMTRYSKHELSTRYVSDRRRRASESAEKKTRNKKGTMTKSLEDNLDSCDGSPVRTRRGDGGGGGICSTLCWGYGRADSSNESKRDKSTSSRTHSPAALKHKAQQKNTAKKATLKADLKKGIDFLDVYQSQLWCEADKKKEREGVHNYRHVVKEMKI